MKQIVYLVDSLSPLALKSFSEKFYEKKILKTKQDYKGDYS
jgi:hypothetical protein